LNDEIFDSVINKELSLTLRNVASYADLHMDEDDASAVIVIDDITEYKEYGRALETEVRDRTLELTILNEKLKAEIEEHKTSKAALALSKQQYSFLVDNTLTGIYIIMDGRISFCNQRFAQIFKYQVSELLGQEFLSLVYPDDIPVYLESVPGLSNEMRCITRTSEIIWIKYKVIDDHYSKKDAVLGNVINITQQKNIKMMSLKPLRKQSLSMG